MKIILAFCLVALVGCSSLPQPVHPKDDVFESRLGDSRIVNGYDAEIGQFPWQMSLQTTSHICGAVIIGDQYALTAAHCVDGGSPTNYKVRVGSTYHANGGSEYDISDIIVHPNYDQGSGAYPNDIAILKFNDTITGANAEPAILPTTDYAGVECKITGWGRTCGSCNLPQTLKQEDIWVISNSECSGYWGNNINNGHVCVYTGNSGSCNGDSGGPLTYGNTVIGVTSWGASGCSTSYPSVYTRITHFLPWITANTK